MKRELLLRSLQVAGFHDDTGAFASLYSENHISRQMADEMYRQGKDMKRKGIKCDCHVCGKNADSLANAPRIVQEHAYSEENGWFLVRELPEDSTQWTQADFDWFGELFTSGVEFVRIGETMYTRKL